MKTVAWVGVAVGVGLLAAAVFAGLKFSDQNKTVSTFMDHFTHYTPSSGGPIGNPPVKIVGGSMTFRSYNQWNPSTSTSPVSTATSSPNIIQLEHVQQPNATNISDLILPICNSAWIVEVDARDNAGDAISTTASGMKVCSDPACGLTGSNSTTIYLLPTGQGGFHSDPAASSPTPDVPNASDLPLNPYYGLRYRDKTISTSGSTCTWDGFCEHIFQVKVTIGSSGTPVTYACPDGECRVDIGQ